MSAYVEVVRDTDDGEQKVCRYIPFTPKKSINGYADFIETLDPLLTFPDSSAKKMTNTTESYPNGLKVSATSNPMYFPVENTYQVGSAEIVAMMSNAVAVGTGQTGSAPLYVFCKDGIYAMFVDETGEMTYTNSRIIARDVCNNARSVTPIDTGVVFTTDRGLMAIAGSEVQELGQPVEGDVFDITDTADKAKKIMYNAFSLKKIANLPASLLDNVDFLTFLKGSIINYNHNERELMVSNNEKDGNGNRKYEYTYILDREGQWSRRDIAADEYLNNFPTSYRVEGKKFYKVDKDLNDSSTDNRMFALSQVIKLDSIGFKEVHRIVVRGYFETDTSAHIGLYIFGSYDGRQWALIGGNEKSDKFTDIGCKVAHTDIRFLRVCLAGQLSGKSRIDYMEISSTPSMLNSKIR